MTQVITLKKAVSLFLNTWEFPVITDYQLGRFIFHVYQKKEYLGNPVQVNKSVPDAREFSSLITQCLTDGILNQNRDFPTKSVFDILGQINPPAEDIVCTMNPFAYVSHLSAMDYHGLTDRNPKTLYISTPSPRLWKQFAEVRMEKELGEYLVAYKESGFPQLHGISLKKVNKRPIHVYWSSHPGAFKNVKNRPLRVSTIGRTFLDMLREMDLCGGIEHVLEVYQQYASMYQNLIVEEIDRHGKPIDKVRAGYILEEMNGLHHPGIQKWEKFIQRGGSRKLDPAEEYSTVYSEKWCLSINTIQERTK